MTYNMTTLQEALTIYDLLVYANNSADGLLTGLFMVALCFIMIMGLKKNGFDNALLVSSFVCSVLSMLLRWAELINFMFVIAFSAVFFLTVLYVFVVQKE